MDANAERVIARLYAIENADAQGQDRIASVLCSALVPDRAGDFAQALMDLGSAICTPKRPACANCPWTDYCRARRQGIQELLPVKAPKMVRPLKRGAAFVVRDRTGAVLLVKRPDKGLLASMLEPPLGPWSEGFPSPAKALTQAPFPAKWKKRPGIVRHGFTHFELEIEVYVVEVEKRPTQICHPRPSAAKAARGGEPATPEGRERVRRTRESPANAASGALSGRTWKDPGGKRTQFGGKHLGSLPSARGSRASPGMTSWVMPSQLREVALPTVMRKIVEHGLEDDGPLFSSRKP